MQETLIDIPEQIAVQWQRDAIHTLEEALPYLLTKNWEWVPQQKKDERSEKLVGMMSDLLFRAGRL